MIPDDASWRFLSERFVFNERTGEFFLLSAEAARAFRMVLEGASADTIAQTLVREFAVERTTALRDAEQFWARLRELKLISPVSGRLNSSKVSSERKV